MSKEEIYKELCRIKSEMMIRPDLTNDNFMDYVNLIREFDKLFEKYKKLINNNE